MEGKDTVIHMPGQIESMEDTIDIELDTITPPETPTQEKERRLDNQIAMIRLFVLCVVIVLVLRFIFYAIYK